MSTETAEQLTLAAQIIKCAYYFEGKDWTSSISERRVVILACIAEAMRRRGITLLNSANAMRCSFEGVASHLYNFRYEKDSSFMEAMASSFANPEKYL